MKAITLRQPWASLIMDRRRHVIVKTWRVQPGERFVIHSSAGRDDELTKAWYGNNDEVNLDKVAPKNAILGLVEVKKCFERDLARKSKYDASSQPPDPNKPRKKEYAIAVRTIEKLRKPRLNVERPSFRYGAIWEYEYN